MPASEKQVVAAALSMCNKISITQYHKAFIAALCVPFNKKDLPIIPVDIANTIAEMVPIKKISDLELIGEDMSFNTYRINNKFELELGPVHRSLFKIIGPQRNFTVTFKVCSDGIARVLEYTFWRGANLRETFVVDFDRRVNQYVLFYTYMDEYICVIADSMSVAGSKTITFDDNTPFIEFPHGPIYSPDLFKKWCTDHPHIQPLPDKRIVIKVCINSLFAEVKVDYCIPNPDYSSAVKALSDRINSAIQVKKELV